MTQMIFVNLPVSDLERSKAFYEAIGFRNEPKFSNDAAAMMVLSDTISVMLLTHPFYATFTRKPIADANATSQVLLAISRDSPAEVDRITDAAGAAGGRADVAARQEMGAMMYGPASKTRTAIIGNRCGWIGRSPNKGLTRSK